MLATTKSLTDLEKRGRLIKWLIIIINCKLALSVQA